MIRIFGDIHGAFSIFRKKVEETPEGYVIIQLGDWGAWPSIMHNLSPKHWPDGLSFGRDVYFIDGNHEYFPDLPMDIKEPVEMWPHTYYVPRGCVLTLDGIRIGFMGGAESPDKAVRIQGVDWFPEESITYSEMMRFDFSEEIQLLVTHTPTKSLIYHLMGGDSPTEWGYSAKMIEGIWNAFRQPVIVSGHMHFNAKAGKEIIIGEMEYIDIDPSHFPKEGI